MRQAIEELLVADGTVAVRFAVSVADQHQVDVARIVEFYAAEFPQRQHSQPRALAIRPAGNTSPFLELPLRHG